MGPDDHAKSRFGGGRVGISIDVKVKISTESPPWVWRRLGANIAGESFWTDYGSTECCHVSVVDTISRSLVVLDD